MRNKKHFINVQLIDSCRIGVAAEGSGCGRGVRSGDCAYWGITRGRGVSTRGGGGGEGTTKATPCCDHVGRGEG